MIFLFVNIFFLFCCCVCAVQIASDEGKNNMRIEPTKIMMDAHFKSESSTSPRWTSAFLGTNDVFGRDIDDIVKRLNSFDKEELEFVSVIGGLKYLQILGRVNFSRITFFDSNINELSKLRLVHKRIAALSYDEWISSLGLIDINTRVVQSHNSFYLPHNLYEDGVEMEAAADFRWPQSSRHLYQDPKGPDARTSPMWTLNNPILFPEYTWNPTREEYNNVRYQVVTNGIVNEKFFLKLPVAIASPSRLAVVWCDGVQFPRGRIRLVSPVSMAIGFYAKFSSKPFWLEDQDDADLNDLWKDAHFWWETRVRLHLRGNIKAYRHLWPPEYHTFRGTAYDYPFNYGVVLEDELIKSRSNRNELDQLDMQQTTTAVVHLYMANYFGHKADSVSNNNVIINCKQRLTNFEKYLYMMANKINGNLIKRILLTEYNKDSNEIDENIPPCSVNTSKLLSIVKTVFANTNFYIRDKIYYMPGERTYNKNMMIILDNKIFDHEFNIVNNNERHINTKQCGSMDKVKSAVCNDNSSRNTAIIGPGASFKEFLKNSDEWVENTITIDLTTKKVPFFYPKGAPNEIIRLFAGQFCQEHLILSSGAYEAIAERALGNTLTLKVDAGMYPL